MAHNPPRLAGQEIDQRGRVGDMDNRFLPTPSEFRPHGGEGVGRAGDGHGGQGRQRIAPGQG
jgi:hypothetical protein